MNSSTRKIGDAASGLAEETRDAAVAELAALREKVEMLMRDRVTPALANVAGRTEEMAHGAADAVRRQTESLAQTVRGQPLAAVGAAALAGVAIGLLIRR